MAIPKKDDKRYTRNQPTGRPRGAANAGNNYVMNRHINYRCTEGYFYTLRHICDVTGKSASTVLHEALQVAAFRVLTDPQHILTANKIL